jgi:hypothetical protein
VHADCSGPRLSAHATLASDLRDVDIGRQALAQMQSTMSPLRFADQEELTALFERRA